MTDNFDIETELAELENENGEKKDKRPDPKPRKYPALWQSYLYWNELKQARKGHLLRLSSIEKGKSNLQAELERIYIQDYTDMINGVKRQKGVPGSQRIAGAKEAMINYGSLHPCWPWLTSIKGLRDGSLAAQLLAQIDDITSFTNVSKLWRFAGQAVVDGHKERCKKGEKAHYSRELSATVWNIGQSFVKQQTPVYAEIYYTEKARLKLLHPEPVPSAGKLWEMDFTPSHIDRMARRKMMKIFLQHLWLQWRTAEGLPTNEPYAIAILKHSDYVKP